MITVERLKELLRYDPLTGLFVWLVDRKSVKAGDTAGSPSVYGYIVIRIDGRQYRANRLAWLYMTGAWPAGLIDHEDRLKSNNVWANLRDATVNQNQHNRAKSRNNSSGFKGVTWHKGREKWMAQIMAQTKTFFLGYHDTAELAHAAYCTAAAEHHGDFARTA